MGKARFGTDGWRGVIADDFTVEDLRQVVQAIMSYITKESRSPKVVIGYDTRFMSDYYARVASEVAAGNGAKVMISPGSVTTPMLSYAVHANAADGGIMITASHNPYSYNGVKFKANYGGSATPKITSEIESYIAGTPVEAVPYDMAREQGAVVVSDCYIAYRDRLKELVDLKAIRKAGFTALLDCMHGSIGGHAVRLRDDLGLKIKPMRAERDPYFGGINPEPVDGHLEALKTEVREGRFDIGFATDGDADRVAIVDGSGGFVTPHQVLSLLTLHMTRNRKQSGLVVKTVSTGSLVDKVAADLGLPVRETPVGFKHICELMLAEDVLIGGEENGGIGIKGNIPERDGMLTALLLMEMMAVEGKPLGELVAGMEKKYGRLYYKRLDLPVEGPVKTELFKDILDKAKAVYAGFGVKDVKSFDGVKVLFGDGSWVLFRPSGTEPLLRVYCESGDPVRLEKIIERAKEAFLG